jgi:hypothetical protein
MPEESAPGTMCRLLRLMLAHVDVAYQPPLKIRANGTVENSNIAVKTVISPMYTTAPTVSTTFVSRPSRAYTDSAAAACGRHTLPVLPLTSILSSLRIWPLFKKMVYSEVKMVLRQ